MIREIWDRILQQNSVVNLQIKLVKQLNPTAIFNEWWISPMGGQARRIKKVIELLDEFQPNLVVETGTFIGTTTPLLATITRVPVKTIEINARLANRNIKMFQRLHPELDIEQLIGSSEVELTKILSNLDIQIKVFAYLDAHWLEFLPVSDELKSLIEWGGDFIALIDDFKVEHDLGYGFDEYQGDKFIGKHLIPNDSNLRVFVPQKPSQLEGLARRGTAYVFSSQILVKYPSIDLSDLVEIDL